jgi:hypothetical protein
MDLMLHSPRLFFQKVWNIIFGTKRLQYSVSELIKMEKKEAKTSYHIACALQGKPRASSSRRRLSLLLRPWPKGTRNNVFSR